MAPLCHIIDFETTQSRDGFRAVEVAVLRVEEDGSSHCTSYLVNPGCRIDSWSREIHGISDAMVRDQPRWVELWPVLEPLLDGQTVLAHYAVFDAGVLRDEVRRHELRVPQIRWLCSCQMARRLWPDFKCHKLEYLRGRLGLEGVNAHRAEADTRLTHALVRRALEELQPRDAAKSVRELLLHQARTNLKVAWPFERVEA